MASFDIHLAVGIKYIEKNNVVNKKDLLRGIIYPDISDNKDLDHYTMNKTNDTLLEHLRCKVSLIEFLKSNDITNVYNKGIFLHLITDYLFFNDFFDKSYLGNISYQEFVNDLYYTYGRYTNYLKDKYDINNYLKFEDLNEYIEKAIENNNYKKGDYKLIFNEFTISNFVDRVSNINLEEYKDKILDNNSNVLP